tara:strand:+ start:3818 stop:4360 length:543 start_codon:yes stop_codon:yes gene_type:complete
MANINDNIRGKKLFKSGSSGQLAVKGSDGEITISSEKATELSALTDISEIYNDEALFQTNKFLLKQIEDLRADVEELHAFTKAAFGKDSSQASSKGSKGDTGSQGPKGDKGDKGDTGATGSQGPKGNTGATGAAGADGKDGKDGSDASVSGVSSDVVVVVNSKGSTKTLEFTNGLLKTVS